MTPRQRRAWQAVAKAKQEAKELGELRAIEPASRRISIETISRK